MSFVGRISVRVANYVMHLLLLAAAFTFLFSDLAWLRLSGILLALFLVDRAIHLKEGDRPISEMPKSGKVNVARHVSPASHSLLERALDRSLLGRRNFYLEMTSQLMGIREIRDGLKRLDVKPDEFREKLEELLAGEDGKKTAGEIRIQIEALMLEAMRNALADKQRFVEPNDIFSALPQLPDPLLKRLFGTFSLEAQDVSHAMVLVSLQRNYSRLRQLPQALSGIILGAERGLRHRIMNRAWTSRPTPQLDHYGFDLTDAARERSVGFLVGHEAEYRRLVDSLSRPTTPNAILVGEPGIGKETIISHLAFDLVKDRVPPALFDKRLVGLRLANLVAGAPPEELQKRIQIIADEIITAGNVILYIPDVHNLVSTSGTAYLSAADGLMPIIRSNLFPVVGTTYPREYKSAIEPRSDFANFFEIIRVNEISEEEAERLLAYQSFLLEKQTGIFITFGAVKTAVRLARKFFRSKLLPSSAEELLKSALASVGRRKERFLGPEQVIAAAEERVNVPIHEAGQGEADLLLRMESVIHENFVDQAEAVKAVSDALRQYRSGLARPGGPIASFLFIGPTGVGKTELSKILARIQFGSEAAMLRFDMTEYQDKQSFYRFIGSPDGNVSGALTEAVMQKPYSLVLLDEFEKAYPDILHLFLQVLDDGRLTDNLGRTVDFTNTIIIATSNAHSDLVNDALRQGQNMSQISEYLKAKLTDVFKPELLNRFSKIIVFKDLSPKEVEEIAGLNLKNLARTLSDQGISLEFDGSAVKQIAKLGYDPAFGARPLRRVIDDHVRSAMAEKILRKEVGKGDLVRLFYENDGFEIRSAEVAARS